MNFKEIDGKRYIEFSPVLTVVLTALICFVASLIFIGWVLYQNSEAIMNDPLVFGARVYNVSSCYCQTNYNVDFGFNQSNVWKKSEVSPQIYSFNATAMRRYLNFTNQNGTAGNN